MAVYIISSRSDLLLLNHKNYENVLRENNEKNEIFYNFKII